MFAAYVGRPGGGKSYDAVRKIVHNLRLGRVVATNIDGMNEKSSQEAIKALAGLDDEQFHERFIFLQKDDVTNFWKSRVLNPGSELEVSKPLVPPGSLVVLDEVHKWINAREWNSEKNKDFCEWGAEHRHDGYDVILITQDIAKIDKQVRSLIEWTYFYRKVNFFGSLVKKRYVKYSYDGSDHEGKPPVPPSTYTYDPRYFLCYKSYKLPAMVEKDFQTHINVLRHPVFYALPVVLALALYSLSKSSVATGDFLGAKKRLAVSQALRTKAPANTTIVKSSTPAGVAVAPPPLPPPVPAAGGSAAFSHYSSGRPAYVASSSDYVSARFGYIEAGGKRIILVGKHMIKLPSRSVRNLDYQSCTCEVKRVLLDTGS